MQSDPATYDACSTEDDQVGVKASTTDSPDAGTVTAPTPSTAAAAPAADSAGSSGDKGVETRAADDQDEDAGRLEEAVDEGSNQAGGGNQASGGEAADGSLGRSPLALISAPFRALAGAVRSGFRRIVGALPVNHEALKQDKTAAYRFASHVDNVIGAVLFVGYIVTMVVILSVYS